VELTPNSEEGWLILAEVASSPRARVAYLQKAREIHSKGISAVRGQEQAKASPQRGPLYPVILILLACAAVGFAAWSAATSPVSASILGMATPTHENVWALAEIAKPTYTPAPTSTSTPMPTDTPTPLPTEMPTETPGTMLVETVLDASGPEYVAPRPDQPVPPAYAGSKYILVDISEQHLYAYEGNVLVYSFVASTGIKNGTRVGTFHVQSKIPNAYGSTWNIWMPNWLGIYWAGGLENGIHALPILPSGARLWAGFLGRPISYGCVVLGSDEAQSLYDWAEMGTPVEIQR